MIRTESRFSFFLKFPLWQFVTTQTQRKLFIGCWRPRPFPQSQSRLHDLYREVIIPSSFCSWPIIELLCSIGTAILISVRGRAWKAPMSSKRRCVSGGNSWTPARGGRQHTRRQTQQLLMLLYGAVPERGVGGALCHQPPRTRWSVVHHRRRQHRDIHFLFYFKSFNVFQDFKFGWKR